MADLGELDAVVNSVVLGGADLVPTHAHIVRYRTMLDSVDTPLVVILRDRRDDSYLASAVSAMDEGEAVAVFTHLPDTGLESNNVRGLVVAPNNTRNSAVADWIAAVTV